MAAWFSRRSWGRNACRSLAPCKRIPISKLIREIFVCGIWRDPANFCCGIRNPGIWNLECAQGIRNLTNDWDPESKLSFIDKESGIHGLKSRIQDYLRFPYIWQKSMIQLRWSRLLRSDHIHYRPRCRTFCVYNFKKFQSRWFLQCIVFFQE